MKMDYRRDLQHNYLVVETGEKTENYITRMMTENQVQGLLGCECRRMDQKKLYYYDITSKISLAEKSRLKKVKGSEVLLIIQGLLQVLVQLEEYLIPADQICLDWNYIYLDPVSCYPSFCCLPAAEKELEQGIRELLEELLPRLDHQEQTGVSVVYELCQYAIQDTFLVMGLQSVLERRLMEERKTTETELQACQEKKSREHQETSYFGDNRQAGQVNYKAWTPDAKVSLETLKTVKSPKDAFFPQSENLYTVQRDGKKLSIQPEALKEQNFVVFGMKACDIQGVKVLDNVFLSDPVDSFYAARREHGTIVAMACHEPEESCFCKVFGIDCAEPAADVATWMVDGELYWKALTDKGEALTKAVESLLTEADGTDAEKLETEKTAIRAIVEKLPYSDLSLEGWNGDALTEKFNSPVWEELYKPCLACGTCTFVCPTCQCYDIKDYDTGHGVQRYRCWDSCMYSDFTMMAHGNNRTSQMQRFRQRFMHKLVYYPANNNGMYSCVGCGRCVEKCPASLNIVKVIKAFEKQGGDK